LEKVSQAEQEQVRLQAEREQALQKLHDQQTKLAQAEEANKEELQMHIQRVEEEQAAREVLRQRGVESATSSSVERGISS